MGPVTPAVPPAPVTPCEPVGPRRPCAPVGPVNTLRTARPVSDPTAQSDLEAPAHQSGRSHLAILRDPSDPRAGHAQTLSTSRAGEPYADRSGLTTRTRRTNVALRTSRASEALRTSRTLFCTSGTGDADTLRTSGTGDANASRTGLTQRTRCADQTLSACGSGDPRALAGTCVLTRQTDRASRTERAGWTDTVRAHHTCWAGLTYARRPGRAHTVRTCLARGAGRTGTTLGSGRQVLDGVLRPCGGL